MLTLFLADPSAVRWELSALGPRATGPYCLVIEHALGEVVEHYMDLRRALLRESELEALLMTAQSIASTDVAWTGPGPREWATRDDRNIATE